jgi:molybdopterin-binding protein
MTAEKEPDKVRLEVDVSGMPLICSVTRHAAETLLLIPGKNVWAVFKASSLHWH